MKLPKVPPQFSALYGDSQKLQKVLSFVMEKGVCDEPYRHWDLLRHLTPPEGLTVEEWWLAIKLQRQGHRRSIPLADISNKYFSFTVNEAILGKLHAIDDFIQGRGSLSGALENAIRKECFISSLMEEAITSSQLEGASTTLVVAKKMLKSHRSPRDKHERMIYNNYLAMERLQEIAEQNLSVEMILELHRIVTEGTLSDPSATGRFRFEHEKVVVEDALTGDILHHPPPASQLKERVQALCDFANMSSQKLDHAGYIHPVLRAIMIHFWLSYDHPFVDGNGRTARALFYWSMLHSKYWLCGFVSISQYFLQAPVKYARSFLYSETDDNDLNYFIIYQLEVLKRALTALYAHVERKITETKSFETSLKAVHAFNPRQEQLLIRALKDPQASYTIQEHKNSHQVAYDTARNDLQRLVERGFLLRKNKGNTFVFCAAPDLKKLLGLQ